MDCLKYRLEDWPYRREWVGHADQLTWLKS